MEGVREYLFSVTAGAILCGVLRYLVGDKGSISGLFRLICGMFLCFLVISPFIGFRFADFTDYAGDILADGQQAVREGEDSANRTLRQIITDETRAYIMDKARSYGAQVQVEIILSEENPPVPAACTIRGTLSPYVRQQLRKILVHDLDIPEEKHTWIP